jgi:hypothetical protein
VRRRCGCRSRVSKAYEACRCREIAGNFGGPRDELGVLAFDSRQLGILGR